MNNSVKYIIAAIIILVGVVGVSFYSCEKEEITPNEYTPQAEIQELDADASNTDRTSSYMNDPAGERLSPSDFFDENYVFTEPEHLCGKAHRKDMINEDGKVVGSSYVFNTDKYFYIWMVTNEGVEMNSAYMHMSANSKTFPLTNSGKPDYSKFKYSIPESKEFTRMLSFEIPVDQVLGESWVAVLAKAKNANGNWLKVWVGESILNNEVPIRLFQYKTQECVVDPKDPGAPSTDEAES